MAVKKREVRPRSKRRCVYCTRETAAEMLTRDHVIAESWYPTSTPPNMAKWKVDCCRTCNGAYGRVEQELLILLALCLNPHSPASSSIVQKALDSMNPDLATSDREKGARLALKRRVYSRIEEADELPDKGVLPSFLENWKLGSRMRVYVSKADLHAVVRKWVRGLHSLTIKRILPKRAKIDVIHIQDDEAAAAFTEVEPFAVMHLKPPCVSVMQATASEETEAETIYRFVLWEQYTVYATVSEKLRRKRNKQTARATGSLHQNRSRSARL